MRAQQIILIPIIMAFAWCCIRQAHAQITYANCNVPSVTAAYCPDRPSSYAGVNAHLDLKIAFLANEFGPNHGYTRKCMWTTPQKTVIGFLQYYAWDCPVNPAHHVQRAWLGNDCPIGTSWDETSNACWSTSPLDPGKNNQCDTSTGAAPGSTLLTSSLGHKAAPARRYVGGRVPAGTVLRGVCLVRRALRRYNVLVRPLSDEIAFFTVDISPTRDGTLCLPCVHYMEG